MSGVGNTVGRLRIRKQAIKVNRLSFEAQKIGGFLTKTNKNIMTKRKTYKITDIKTDEMAILMGALLGDCYLGLHGKNYRFKIEHSWKQKDFVYWIHEKLKDLCSNTKDPTFTKANKTRESSIVFYSNTSLIFKDLHNLFYKIDKDGKYVKTISKELVDKLPMSPMVLAVLWMCDGSVRDDCYSGKLASMGFPIDQQELLVGYFKKWGIDCHTVLNSEAKNHYYITIPSSSFPRLVEIIEPIVNEIPAMVYKLNPNRRPRND